MDDNEIREIKDNVKKKVMNGNNNIDVDDLIKCMRTILRLGVIFASARRSYRLQDIGIRETSVKRKPMKRNEYPTYSKTEWEEIEHYSDCYSRTSMKDIYESYQEYKDTIEEL